MVSSSKQILPADVVREIFKYFSTTLVIPTPEMYIRPAKLFLRLLGFPWYLGHICSSWRTTFFSMYSEFWSAITIRAHRRYSHSKWNNAISEAKWFLDHTERRPFSFSVDAKFQCPPILDLFIAESNRWKSVSLCLDDDDENIPLLRRVKNHIPQLRSLSVSIKLGMPRDFPSIFEDASTISCLSLIRIGNWHMDWNLLTRLALTHESNLGRLLRVLSQTTNLEHLEFNKLTIVDPEDLGDDVLQPVTLPRLRILEIHGFTILEYLTTPGLQGLYVLNRPNELVDGICFSFFARSSCSLERLGLIKFYSPEDLVNILHYTPELKVLSVWDMSMREVMKVFTCRTGEQVIMPQLEVLRLPMKDILFFFASDEEEVEGMIESRISNRVHSCQELKVIFSCTPSGYKKKFKHPNVQSRVDITINPKELLNQFRWLCDDSG